MADLDELLDAFNRPLTGWDRVIERAHSARRFARSIPREIRWAWQRSRRGYSDRDVWGFDTHLARIISGGVRQLIGELHGWPGPPMTFEEWQGILDKIATGFEAYLALHEETPFDEAERDRLARQFDEGLGLLGEHLPGLWD